MIKSLLSIILDMSLTGGAAVIVVLLARIVLIKAPKAFMRVLWLAALFCMLCPFRLSLPFSAPELFDIKVKNTIIEDITDNDDDLSKNSTGTTIAEDAFNSENTAVFEETLEENVSHTNLILFTAWFFGCMVLLVYGIISYMRLLRCTRSAVRADDNIYLSDKITSPFVMGLIHPKICLPKSISPSDEAFVISHEKAHIRHFDYILKPIAYLAVAVHWFNPFSWLMFYLFSSDSEMFCDEAAVKNCSYEMRGNYCRAIVDFSVNISAGDSITSFFRGNGVKSRIKNVMNKKRIPGVIAVLCALISVILCTFIMSETSDYVSFSQIDDVGKLFIDKESVTSVRVITPEADVIIEDADEILFVSDYISQIQVGSRAVSLSRSEDRDKSIQMIFISENGVEGSINISEDYSEVWYDNKVKPSFSYRVQDTELLKSFVGSLINSNPFTCVYYPRELIYLSPTSSASPDYFEDHGSEVAFTVSDELFSVSSEFSYISSAVIENPLYEKITAKNAAADLSQLVPSLKKDFSKYENISAYRVVSNSISRDEYRIYCLNGEVWMSAWRGAVATPSEEYQSKICLYIFKVSL